MIEKMKGRFHLVCDCCGESVACDSFDEAVQHKKDNEWKSMKYGDVWQDYCGECANLEGDQ